MSEFLAMGGYASYVWSAWGITLLVLVLNAWSARRRHARTSGRKADDRGCSKQEITDCTENVMTPRRRQRLMLVGLVVAGVAVSAALALRAFQENLEYFFSPTQVAAGEAPTERLSGSAAWSSRTVLRASRAR